ncbi:MAG: nucleotide exchange factor GrpE [Candidatus Neomarinimicrobiota bacterium]
MPVRNTKQQQPATDDEPKSKTKGAGRTDKGTTSIGGGAPKEPVQAITKEQPVQRPTDTEKIHELEARFKELEDRYIRLRAEYDNHIKRSNKEKDELITYAGSYVFRSILPILDDLRRTVDHARQDESQKDDPVLQGIELIIEKFAKFLEAEGVQIFNSVGEAFDPELHEALMTRSSNEHPPGTVLEEYEPGYKYRDKVLRHAKVVVSG